MGDNMLDSGLKNLPKASAHTHGETKENMLVSF